MYQQMLKYPILGQIDTQTVKLTARRVPDGRLATFQLSNMNAAGSLFEHGIRF